MATLKEIQNCELQILRTVVDICERHKINYYLTYGSLLGAIRHNGFIPWDDDIDIFMGYDDIKKFKKICKKELPKKYFFQDYETDPGANWIFSKIRDNDTYMPEFGVERSKDLTINEGIWIDIFPLLDASSDYQNMIKQIKYIFKFQHSIVHIFDYKKSQQTDFKHKLLLLLTNTKYRIMSKYYMRKFEKLQDKDSELVIETVNSYWDPLCENSMEKALFKTIDKSWLEPQKFPFEGYEFTCFKEYDKYLKKTYGEDYMTPKRWEHVEDYSDVIV